MLRPPVLDRKVIGKEVWLYLRTGDELLKNNKPKDAVNAYERGLKLLEELESCLRTPASGQFPICALRFRYMRGLARSQASIGNIPPIAYKKLFPISFRIQPRLAASICGWSLRSPTRMRSLII